MVPEGEMAITAGEAFSTDSLTLTEGADSLTAISEPVYALLLTPPEPEAAAPVRPPSQWGISVILTSLFLLFFVVALRIRNNGKYAASIFRNLTETRTRHNVFDDTVRESSLVILLNILWCVSAGVILYATYSYFAPERVVDHLRALDMVTGMIAALGYTVFMIPAYYTVGWIFSDSDHARMWVKGFMASQGLMSPAFFIISLLSICYPLQGEMVFISAICIFILAKFVFIWKGYRIFFSQFSSWVLFLCYLCSLEIVPLLMTYKLAILIGSKIA